jgi:hypothetical protein
MEQLTKPSGLNHGFGDGAILGLYTRVGDDGLPLDQSGDQVGPQEHRIA